ncbi:MAG: isoprenylcysteine carboxylmethyltransferase family protein [Candidatus Lokiarchaeota archaeon]|nr:isoprenylcysteine carboxylmethyltransferase family protein [Candidatus Lokiarchaeota archaeon]
MEPIHKQGPGQEHQKSHIIQLFAMIIFFIIWIIDSFIFTFSTILTGYIPIIIQIIGFISFLPLGLILSFRAGHVIFQAENSNKLITTGILSHTRHPLYLGVLIIYVGFIFLTMSLISIVGLIIAFLLYNYIASFEENELIEIFKEEYLEYKKRVPKWIPSIRSR